MSRLPDRNQENMTDEQQAVAEEIISGPHGHLVGPYHAWLESPELARRARSLSEFIRFQSSLPKRLSELAILVTGRYWRAEYEFYAHAKLAKKAGLDDGIIADIARQQIPTFTQDDEQVVFDLCTEMYETHRLSNAVYERSVKMLGRQAVVEVIATIGYYSLVSMTLNAFEMPLPDGESSAFPD